MTFYKCPPYTGNHAKSCGSGFSNDRLIPKPSGSLHAHWLADHPWAYYKRSTYCLSEYNKRIDPRHYNIFFCFKYETRISFKIKKRRLKNYSFAVCITKTTTKQIYAITV